MAATVTCYGSTGEIGGNKILIEDGAARIGLDFGIAFGRQGKYYNELLRPRAVRGLLDPLALGLLPPLEGIYRKDIETPGLWERVRSNPCYRDLTRPGAPGLDAVMVSHAHLDHNGDLAYLDERIPIFTSRVSAFIARAMQITGQPSLEREISYIGPREANAAWELQSGRNLAYRIRPHAFLDGSLSSQAQDYWENPPGVGSQKCFEVSSAVQAPEMICELPYRWWPVDHSIPGAVGVAIQTSSGWIGYTGDIRFHGKAGANTRVFGEALRKLRLSALICEGTHVDLPEHQPVSEEDIFQNGLALAKAAGGRLVIADFGPRNLERLFTFLEIARATGRTLLVQPKDIYLLQAIALADPETYRPPEALTCLSMYGEPKAAPRGWEKVVREAWSGRAAGPSQVSADPGGFILAASLWDLNNLPDLSSTSGGVYLYSNSKAYDDEQEADLDRLRAWVSWSGMKLYGDPDDPETPPLHASGHGSCGDLREFIREVQPQLLIPVHTEDPSWCDFAREEMGIRVVVPRYGEAIPL